MGPPRPPPAITPEILLRAYAIGLFPMAESADDPTLFWLDPEQRGIFPARPDDRVAQPREDPAPGPLSSYGRPRFRRRDRGLRGRGTRPAPDLDQRPDPGALPKTLRHRLRPHGRSLRRRHSGRRPLWRRARRGLLRREHVPHRRDASKICLLHLAARLRSSGYLLLDTQFVTPHLASLGAVEVPRATLPPPPRQSRFPAGPRPGPGRSSLSRARTPSLS